MKRTFFSFLVRSSVLKGATPRMMAKARPEVNKKYISLSKTKNLALAFIYQQISEEAEQEELLGKKNEQHCLLTDIDCLFAWLVSFWHFVNILELLNYYL